MKPSGQILLAAAFAMGLAAAGAPCARADAFAESLAEAQRLLRTTTFALRSGRNQEAEAALKRLVAVWEAGAAAAREHPAPLLAGIPMLAERMEGGAARLGQAAGALAQGRADSALEIILPLRREWISIRRAAGFYGLVECLDEAGEALEALVALRRPVPDLARAETRGDIIARAAVYRFALRRCDAFAAADIAADGDYRRQVEAIMAALDVVDSALRLRDPGLLDRVLTDLKTFGTQLSQRFAG